MSSPAIFLIDDGVARTVHCVRVALQYSIAAFSKGRISIGGLSHANHNTVCSICDDARLHAVRHATSSIGIDDCRVGIRHFRQRQ